VQRVFLDRLTAGAHTLSCRALKRQTPDSRNTPRVGRDVKLETARFAHGVLRESAYLHLTISQNGSRKPTGKRAKSDSLHTPYSSCPNVKRQTPDSRNTPRVGRDVKMETARFANGVLRESAYLHLTISQMDYANRLANVQNATRCTHPTTLVQTSNAKHLTRATHRALDVT
jgi:hypothetical protein